MEEKIKFAGKYDIQDGKLVQVTYKAKDELVAIICYSEEMGTVYFHFEMGDMAQKTAITDPVDVEPDWELPLEQAWYSFRDAVVEALRETTWRGECPLWHLDYEFLDGTAEYFAEQIFRARALEELDSIL